MFVLSREIFNKRPFGTTTVMVVGRRGAGKTVFALKTGAQLFKKIDPSLTDEQAYKKALNCLVFSIDQLIDKAKKHNTDDITKYDNRMPMLIWDDAGVHGQGAMYQMNANAYIEVKSLIDNIRTFTNALIITTPDRDGVAKFMRNFKYLVQITTLNDGYQRKATGYSIYQLPSGMRRVSKKWMDHYSCYLDNKIYGEYWKMRNKSSIAHLDNVDKRRIDKNGRRQDN